MDSGNEDRTGMNEMVKWADAGMYHAEPIEEGAKTENGVMPKVYLLHMTPDPLGAIAAMNYIYQGRVVRSLTELTDDDRREQWDNVLRAHLEAPLEAVKFHFLIEGVDRSFTHQMVRQRTATYAQESMRFAVKEDSANEVVIPPHIAALDKSHPARAMWEQSLKYAERAYESLIGQGIPAEDARALLPHATATRIHYITDLRGLKREAGNRLCTQAQFHWRLVFAQMINAIRMYGHQIMEEDWSRQTGGHPNDIPIQPGDEHYDKSYGHLGGWQFETIADSMLFRPVCYHLNRCPWKDDMANIRTCAIKDRVDGFARGGIPSEEWEDHDELEERAEDECAVVPEAINPVEWLANPDAAIRKPDGSGMKGGN